MTGHERNLLPRAGGLSHGNIERGDKIRVWYLLFSIAIARLCRYDFRMDIISGEARELWSQSLLGEKKDRRAATTKYERFFRRERTLIVQDADVAADVDDAVRPTVSGRWGRKEKLLFFAVAGSFSSPLSLFLTPTLSFSLSLALTISHFRTLFLSLSHALVRSLSLKHEKQHSCYVVHERVPTRQKRRDHKRDTGTTGWTEVPTSADQILIAWRWGASARRAPPSRDGPVRFEKRC